MSSNERPQAGMFRVTIRVERPDGQFALAYRDVPDDLGPAPEVAERITGEIAVEFVKVYGRAARLPA